MAGSITPPKRPRYEANERFDTSDADAASRSPREHTKALTRAVLSTPQNGGGIALTGLIITGFELTLNPTSGSDGKVRVSSSVGVAIDADGNTLIKGAGSIDVAIPAGSQQLYVYLTEFATDSAKRRFLSVTQPFTEAPRTISTSFQGDVSYYVRGGTNSNIVAEDNVNGTTTPLCIIGIVTNTAGVITCAGYNATNAPNGADITNRLSTAQGPVVAPTLNTRNGSMRSLTDMLQAMAFMIGQATWRGSSITPPTAANNFQAWTPHTSSIAVLAEYLAAGNFVGPSSFNSTLSVTGLITAIAGFHNTTAFDAGVTIAGLLTANAAITAAGLITANGGVTAGVNQHVTVSGTGQYKHGTRTFWVRCSGGRAILNGGAVPSQFYSDQIPVGASTTMLVELYGIQSHWRITGIDIYMAQTPTGTPTYSLVIATFSAGSGTTGFSGSIAGTSISSGALKVSIPGGLNTTFAAPLFLQTATAGGQTTALGLIEVRYDVV